MMRPRARTLVIAALTVVVLGVLGWFGWQALTAARALDAAGRDATTLRAAVVRGDDAAADRALTRLREHSGDARSTTRGWSWSVLGALPVVGDDARGVATVSRVLDDLAQRGLRPLAEVSQDLPRLVPRDGAIDVDQVRALQEPVGQAAAALAEADRELDREDPSGFVGRLQVQYRDLAEEVESAAGIMAAADQVAQVLPDMLGEDQPQRYLLVLQNNAEIRATGGLPGSVSVVEVADGRLQITRQSAANFGRADAPVLPLTEAEQALYGEELGTFFVDANFTPDFPRAAELMAARWEEAFPAEPIDGVVAVDPVFVSYLLEAAGPVQVNGDRLSSDNVVDEVLHQVYLDYADPADQDAFFAEVASQSFDQLTAGGRNPRAMIEALARGAREHRVLLHSFDEGVQEVVGTTAVGGETDVADTTSPTVVVALNDATGAKMSYYLRHEARVSSTACVDGVQSISGSLKLTSTAPDDAASRLPDYVTGGGAFDTVPGNQVVTVRLFSPTGGSVSDLTLADRPLPVNLIDDNGRAATTVVVELAPGDTVDLTWRMRSGAGQDGDLRAVVTPGIEPQQYSTTAPSQC